MSDIADMPAESTRARWLAAFGIVASAFVTYWTSLTNRFVSWDDTYLIYFNPAVKRISFSTLKTIFTTYDPELYVPFTLFTYQLDYAIAGLSAFMYHFHSLVLHAGSALLVAWIVRTLSRRPAAGLLAGLMFALHPLHVEAVSWASGRKDVVFAFWFLASLALFLRYRMNGAPRTYALSIACFLLSLLGKVSAITLPLVLLLVDWRERRPLTKGRILEMVPYFALSIAFTAIGMLGKKDITAASTLIEKLLMAAKSTVFYLQKVAVPTDLTVIYPYVKPVTLSSPDFWLPLAIVIALALLVLWSLRRTREVAFGVGLFFVTLAPSFINFKKAGDAYFASDRYAYIPSLGLFFLVGIAVTLLPYIARTGSARRAVHSTCVGTCAVVLALFALLSHRQSLTWKDSETLFTRVVALYPESIAARINLSRIYRETGRLDEAEAMLKESLKIRETAKAYSGLAATEEKRGNSDRARFYYEKAIATDPKDPEPVFGIGIMEAQLKNYAKAEELYKRAIALNANFVGILNNLGALYMEQGKAAEAEAQYRAALEMDPYYPDAHYNLATLYEDAGKFDEAIVELRLTLESDPDSLDATVRLGSLLAKHGDADEAVPLLRSALRAQPEDGDVQRYVFDGVKAILTSQPDHADSRSLFQELMDSGVLQRKST